MNDETRSDSPAAAGSVVVRRYVDERHAAIVSRADFSGLFSAWRAHWTTWEEAPLDGLTDIAMRQGLAAAVLHLATKRRGEEAAFTINIANPPLNLFLTGDNWKGTITGRAFTRDVRTAGGSRMFVETRRKESSFRSAIEIQGLDVIDHFNQYYVTSEQKAARFYEISDVEFMMIFGLPVQTHEWMEAVDITAARSMPLEKLKRLDEPVFWFQCGCDPEKMITAVRSIYQGKTEELFQDDPRVQLACPRCGRKWWLTKERFIGGS